MDNPSLSDYLAILRRRRTVGHATRWSPVSPWPSEALSLLQTPSLPGGIRPVAAAGTTSEEILVDEVGQVGSSTDTPSELNNEIRTIQSRTVSDAVDDVYDGPLDVDDVSATTGFTGTDGPR